MRKFKRMSEVKVLADKALVKFIREIGDPEPEYANGPFDYYLGGNVYVVESFLDIKQIPTSIPNAGSADGWATLFEASDAFDICEWVLDGKYVQLTQITNNSGGDTWLIPAHAAELVPTLLQSIELSAAREAEVLEDNEALLDEYEGRKQMDAEDILDETTNEDDLKCDPEEPC